MEALCVCSLPADQRRGYSNVFNALARITREEGVTTLWRVNAYTRMHACTFSCSLNTLVL